MPYRCTADDCYEPKYELPSNVRGLCFGHYAESELDKALNKALGQIEFYIKHIREHRKQNKASKKQLLIGATEIAELSTALAAVIACYLRD